MADGERCEDGNPDGIRYLITLLSRAVTAADGKRYDGSYHRTEYRAQQSINNINDESLYQTRSGTTCRRLKQLGRNLAARIVGRADIADITLGDGIGSCRCIGSDPLPVRLPK